MKKNYFFFAILSIPLVFSLFAIVSYVSEVRLDGIWLDKTSSPSTAWGVKGRVRNLENHPIKGYVELNRYAVVSL
ncbi:MAG: hypothetical protein JRI96_17215 [Deltaproteobacteria bacterium]|nr:hypothetical protein [Deltaproteobacteria bacterium]